MSDTAAPAMPEIGIATIIERTRPREDRPKCHTIDHRGWALCGAFGPDPGAEDVHSRKECRARGHRHCVVCDELHGQLGDDSMVR